MKELVLTAEGLVEFAKKCLVSPNIYVWSCAGEYLTDEVLDEKIAKCPDWYTPERIAVRRELANRGIRGFDCVGLIRSYLWGDYHQGNASRYKAEEHVTTAQLIGVAKVQGDIAELPERPGVILWKPGHVGIYIGNGQVIESTSRKKKSDERSLIGGIIQSDISEVKWEKWLEYPGIQY